MRLGQFLKTLHAECSGSSRSVMIRDVQLIEFTHKVIRLPTFLLDFPSYDNRQHRGHDKDRSDPDLHCIHLCTYRFTSSCNLPTTRVTGRAGSEELCRLQSASTSSAFDARSPTASV